MSTPTAIPKQLNTEQLALLKNLGYSDHDGDGLIGIYERQACETAILEDERTAFGNLAKVGEDPADEFIDATDLETLQNNSLALAKLIRSDPAFQKHILAGGNLNITGEAEGSFDGRDPGLKPVEHTRLLTYVQLAYHDHLFKSQSNWVPNGHFGPTTIELTDTLQLSIGIYDGNSGKLIGPQTLGAILLHLEHDPQDILAGLISLRDELTLNPEKKFTLKTTTFAQQQLIVSALKYLHPERFNLLQELSATDPTANDALIAQADLALRQLHTGNLIGPIVCGELVTALKSRLGAP